jgi:small subunit ribosomal protein S18
MSDNNQPMEEKKPMRSAPREYNRDNRDFRDRDRDRDGGEGDGDYGGRRGRQKVFFKRKVCRFCKQTVKLDYKEADTLKKFITERGKIIPGRITGTCAKHQRKLAKTIKQARALALIPFVEKYR